MMATIRKRGPAQWQAQVRRDGFPPQSKTFETRKDADAWARMIEREMDTGAWRPRSDAEITTLREALERYAREETSRKKGEIQETKRIRVWMRHPLAKIALANIRGVDLARHRDERRAAGAADATIRIEIMLLSAVFEKARKDWGMIVPNPVRTISLPASSRRRERRLEDGEEARLLDALDAAMPRTPARALAAFAIETAMRQGELLGLTWNDIDLRRRIAHLDDTKSGDPRDVPLSTRAVEILSSLPRRIDNGKVFDVSQDRVMRGFRVACQRAGIDDLKFHDLRHEAASRLAEKLSAHELCKMCGWRTMQMSLRYYHPRAEDLARKLG